MAREDSKLPQLSTVSDRESQWECVTTSEIEMIIVAIKGME
jgi:hypothetical protein